MSDSTRTPTRPKGERIRTTIQTFNYSRGQKILGPAELVGLAGSLLILLLVIASYFYLLLPARLKLNALESERPRLQNQLRTTEDTYTQERSTEAKVQDITESLDYFENKKLVGINVG